MAVAEGLVVRRHSRAMWLSSKESTCQRRRHSFALGQEDPLEKEMATHSSIITWRISWTEELGRLQSTGRKELDATERLNNSSSNKWQHGAQPLHVKALKPCSSISACTLLSCPRDRNNIPLYQVDTSGLTFYMSPRLIGLARLWIPPMVVSFLLVPIRLVMSHSSLPCLPPSYPLSSFLRGTQAEATRTPPYPSHNWVVNSSVIPWYGVGSESGWPQLKCWPCCWHIMCPEAVPSLFWASVSSSVRWADRTVT